MVDIRIDIDVDTSKVAEMVARTEAAITPPSLTESLGVGADVIVDAARQFAPKKTGALSDSIGKTEDGVGWEISPFANAGGNSYLYAATQETGQTHYPTSGPFMVFEGNRGGPVFAREVTIPGTHYMELARVTAAQEAVVLIKEDIDAKIEG
jgi:hypothetical protein